MKDGTIGDGESSLPSKAELEGGEIEVRVKLPRRFAREARRFHLTTQAYAYLLCMDAIYRPPSGLMVVCQKVCCAICRRRRLRDKERAS